jgi:hypothetical protein
MSKTRKSTHSMQKQKKTFHSLSIIIKIELKIINISFKDDAFFYGYLKKRNQDYEYKNKTTIAKIVNKTQRVKINALLLYLFDVS